MEEKKQILEKFVAEMEKVFETSLKKIILYGSYARGDFKINSDMDIMILTSLSDSEIKELEKKVYDIAFEYELMYDVMISVNIKNEEHFNYWLGALPYYDNVNKEGIVLAGYF
ncbi:MAG: nucleotidyltransferase domain-containing protein [Lachnospiraceae bacterium]|nr:nucleotidyltransferase domain-containing protein [Lachnospiraceae bacterium]